MNIQVNVAYLILAFLFLTPEMGAAVQAGDEGDPRKKEMVVQMCLRFKALIEDWGRDSGLQGDLGCCMRAVVCRIVFPAPDKND